jgi:hypothetical protein
MANLRIILLLALIVAWWQKDTLEDRALTQEGVLAYSAKMTSRAWSTLTPPSPAKNWVSARDQWLDDLFNPKQDYSHPELDHTLDDKKGKHTAPKQVPAQSRRADPPHTNEPSNEKTINSTITQTPENSAEDKIKRILIVGDSMSGDVGLSLRQLAFKYKQKEGIDIQIIDAHRHSTGLVVPSYYNWPLELPGILKKNEPQVVVFMVGANDGQSMRLENQTWVLPGSPGWAIEYERRVKQIVATMPASAKLVWLDLPPVRLKSLQEKTAMVNESVNNGLASCKNCVHMETRANFGGDAYVENTPGRMLRSKDGVHYSRAGASFVAAKIWTAVGLPLYE